MDPDGDVATVGTTGMFTGNGCTGRSFANGSVFCVGGEGLLMTVGYVVLL